MEEVCVYVSCQSYFKYSGNFAVFLVGLFTKNYLPSYMDKKGENLATKEDIKEITRKTEEVQREFKEEFEAFSSDMKFKYDFFYKQHSELYCKLYAIVIQSEYVRHFIQIADGTVVTFDEAPFLEISPTRRETTTLHIGDEKGASVSKKTEFIETPISKFNKKELCDYIIENRDLASKKLLKLAVSYRFASDHYSGNSSGGSVDEKEKADDKEFRMIKEIVIAIVKDYNYLRKELKLPYNEDELSSGVQII